MTTPWDISDLGVAPGIAEIEIAIISSILT